MTEPRHTTDTITDDALDALYDERDQARTRAKQAEATIERVRACAEQWQAPMVRGEQHPAARQILAILDEPNPAATEMDEMERTARVFAALHRCAEQEVSRVVVLYEQWLKAGPPPLGTPVSRWWDARLAELHAAICPPANHTTEKSR
ncbi:hypothetical protein [Streptomyces sp. NPDC017941]|uniref:hypothetical protein n=1 Tax=Streptomyces sp. NPDC017941 TaxID=3365018 RepID=UPI0037A82119